VINVAGAASHRGYCHSAPLGCKAAQACGNIGTQCALLDDAAACCWRERCFLSAGQLPIRVYTTDDGLPSNQITKIVRDSRGFLWFGTRQGLARFDGYNFTSYSSAHILPDGYIMAVVETRAGNYWIGTSSGPFRLPAADTRKPAQRLANSIRRDDV
jgi:ligand-binding sensor domain-containing protein